MKTKIKGFLKVVITQEKITFQGINENNNLFSLQLDRQDRDAVNEFTDGYIASLIKYILDEEI
jgi:hypothetical protein